MRRGLLLVARGGFSRAAIGSSRQQKLSILRPRVTSARAVKRRLTMRSVDPVASTCGRLPLYGELVAELADLGGQLPRSRRLRDTIA